MKKITIILLAIALLLTGCVRDSLQTDAPTTTLLDPPTTASTTEPQVVQPVVQSPMVTVSLPGSMQEYKAEDGSVIFRYFRQNMSMIVPDQAVADKIIVDFLNRVDQTVQTAEDIHLQAQSAHQQMHLISPYICNITHSPMRIDQTVLSLYGSHILYSGGAHPSYSCCAANYDMLTGEVLTLGSILMNPEAKDRLCQLVTEELSEMAEPYYLWPSYPDTVAQRFAVEESYDENWYFSDEGLCFFFAPYEIAAYASGVIVAEVPYEKLSGVIDDAFFPPEADTAVGTLQVKKAADEDLSRYSRFSELILNPDSPALVVSTDGYVKNVRIYALNQAGQNDYTAYAAQTLSVQDAIVIEASEDTLANMYITYETGGESIVLELTSN